jgi:hypothetical protein
VTLGEALGKQGTDSSIAAEVYAPGFEGEVRAQEFSTDSLTDIRESFKNGLREKYVDEHLKSENINNRRQTFQSTFFIEEAFSKIDERYLPINEDDDGLYELLEQFSPGERSQSTETISRLIVQGIKLPNFIHDKLLSVRNKYSDGSSFYVDEKNEMESFPKGLYSIQEQPNYDINAPTVGIDDLREGAQNILFKSRNDYFSLAMSNVDSESVRIKNNVKKLENLFLDANNNIYKSETRTSYGSGNRPILSNEDISNEDYIRSLSVDDFSGAVHFGMMGVILKSAAYSLILGAAFSSLFALLLMNKTKTVYDSITFQFFSFLIPPQYKRAANEYGVKESFSRFSEDLADGANFLRYFFAGWRAFYGFSKSPRIKTASNWQVLLAFNPRAIADSPTYHYGIARTLLRELQQLGAADDATKLLNKSLKDLNASVNLRFFMMLLKLGYVMEKSGISIDDEDTDLNVAGGISIAKILQGSEKNAKRKLTYGNKNDESNVRYARRSVLQSKQNSNLLSLTQFDHLRRVAKGATYDNYDKDKTKQTNIFRIPKKIVDIVEKEIDVEYVPFSIHDLRNNELISLPAFVESITDNFTASYESNHGYGRIDPIHTYSKTERNVELSFHLVSFNAEDHDRLYTILNMLTAMCYPQRSRGQLRVTTSNNQFYQPFSQLQTASPMIRLRLGNMISSNYSRTGIKKIFGDLMGEKFSENPENAALATKSGDEPVDDQHKAIKDELNRLQEVERQINGNFADMKNGTVFYAALENDVQFSLGNVSFGPSNKNANDDALLNRAVARRSMGGGVLLGFRYAGKIGKSNDHRLEILPTDAFVTMLKSANERSRDVIAAIDRRIKLEKVKYYVKVSSHQVLNLGAIKARIDSLELEYKSYLSETNSQIRNYNENLEKTLSSQHSFEQNFERAETNPIVRSFESTSGKGLAGFIKNLGIDYNGANWRTNTSGWEKIMEEVTASKGGYYNLNHLSVAPMRVRVTMSFAPVHDMPLGLDYRGQIIAPTHPVGKWSANWRDRNLSKISEQAPPSDQDLPF